MTLSPNIERFNQLTAQVLAYLYGQFPLPCTLQAAHFGPEPQFADDGTPDPDTEFFLATVRWLTDSGYLRHRGENAFVFYDAVLTTKGLEALYATPESLQGEAPLGERLKAAAASGSQGILLETVKAVLAAGATHLFYG